MVKAAVKIGPESHGQRMSLAEFDHAEVREGHLYELSRGVIIVSDVPNRRHLAQITSIRRQVAAYDLAHPGRIHTVAQTAAQGALVDGPIIRGGEAKTGVIDSQAVEPDIMGRVRQYPGFVARHECLPVLD